MHKKSLLALAGVVTLGVVAGVASFAPGSLLSSVLPMTTTPPCMTEEMHVTDAQKALDAFPERANITERVINLESALAIAQKNVDTLSDKVNAALKKTRYTTLEAFQKDLKTYNDLLAEYTRLTKIRPQTVDVKKLITANTKLRSAHNTLVKKTTKSSLTIAQLNTRYVVPMKKDIEALADAQTALRTAQTALSEARAEQDKIQQAENNLKEVQADLKKCSDENPRIEDGSTTGTTGGTYCYPVRVNDSGEVQTDCVDDVAKIPQCYIKSTIETINDEEGNLSSVNVKSDTGTGELFFCGTPETAYQDPSNPLSNYPTIPGAGSQPGAEAAAPMAEGNPNNPKNRPIIGTIEVIYRGCSKTEQGAPACTCRVLSGLTIDGQPMWNLNAPGFDCRQEVSDTSTDGITTSTYTWTCPNDDATDTCTSTNTSQVSHDELCNGEYDIDPECGNPFNNSNSPKDVNSRNYCITGSVSDLVIDGRNVTWQCGCPTTSTFEQCSAYLDGCGDALCAYGEDKKSCPADC